MNRRTWADPEPQPRGRMIVNTATLTRGQKVHVIERDGPVLTVETSDGRSHIVTVGDVLLSPKNQARLDAPADPGGATTPSGTTRADEVVSVSTAAIEEGLSALARYHENEADYAELPDVEKDGRNYELYEDEKLAAADNLAEALQRIISAARDNERSTS